jgi:hypothetical protein
MVEQAGAFFQDETRLETNPKVGLCWMRKGKQRPLRTPGTNRKVWISGALNFKTGRFPGSKKAPPLPPAARCCPP